VSWFRILGIRILIRDFLINPNLYRNIFAFVVSHLGVPWSKSPSVLLIPDPVRIRKYDDRKVFSTVLYICMNIYCLFDIPSLFRARFGLIADPYPYPGLVIALKVEYLHFPLSFLHIL
jgi:hypothetical protein